MARTEQVRTDLVTTGAERAAADIDKVADAAERLEDTDPTVKVDAATGPAEADLKELAEHAEALSRVDAEIVAKARVDSARADLRQLQADMKETADTARAQLDNLGAGAGDGLSRVADEGGRARSAMANMSGNVAAELGEISGVGGIAAQSIGELAEAAAEGELKLGQLAKVAGPMAGLAVAMTVMSEAMAAANASKAFDAERVKDYTEAIEDGIDPIEQLTTKARELGRIEFRTHTGGGLFGLFSATKDLIPVLADAGLSVEDFSDIVANFATRSTDEWRAALEAQGVSMLDAIAIVKAARDEYNAIGDSAQGATDRTKVLGDESERLRGLLDGTATAAAGVNAVLDVARQIHDNNAAATKRSEDRTRDLRTELQRLDDKFTALRDNLNFEQAMQSFRDTVGAALTKAAEGAEITNTDILAIKASILDVAETAKTNPAVVEAQLKEVTEGNLWAVAGNVENYYARNPVNVASRLNIPAGYEPGTAGGQNPRSLPPDSGTGPAPAPTPHVVNVTQYLPRGWRGDALASARETARRSGGLYRRARR